MDGSSLAIGRVLGGDFPLHDGYVHDLVRT